MKNICRATLRHFLPKDKIWIILRGLRGEDSIVSMPQGMRRLTDDMARPATSDEVMDLHREAGALVAPAGQTYTAPTGHPAQDLYRLLA